MSSWELGLISLGTADFLFWSLQKAIHSGAKTEEGLTNMVLNGNTCVRTDILGEVKSLEQNNK
jgi:hypothetical protein